MTWSSLPSMPTTRSYCQAGFVTYPNGNKGILIAGGQDSLSNGISTVDFLNLDSLIWEPKTQLPHDIFFGASVPFQESFLIVGGFSLDSVDNLDTIYFYDPSLDDWTLLGRMDNENTRLTAFMVPDTFANCN